MSGRGGFTLLEVMVALAVVAIAFTGLLALHVRNLDLVARDQAYTHALLLARSQITDVEIQGFPEIGIATGDFESLHPDEYPGYTWERSVNETPIPGTREVTVRVLPPLGPSGAASLTMFVRR